MGSGGGIVTFDGDGVWVVLLVVGIVLYVVFQAGFWIGCSVGLSRAAQRRRAAPAREA